MSRDAHAHHIPGFDPQVCDEFISCVQSDFPVCVHPYEALAERVGLESGDEAFKLMQDLADHQVIRRMGAIFDSAHVGYRSSLCALAVTDASQFDAVAELVNSYPNVTHNYERPGYFNMWFTVTASSELGIHTILEEIAQKTGFSDYLYLPALHLFKIRVDFDMRSAVTSQDADKTAPSSHKKPTPLAPAEIVVEAFSELDKELVRLLQGDLHTRREPYAFIAHELSVKLEKQLGHSITEDVVLQRIRNWKFNGTIRRLGVAIKHRKMGFTSNGMVVWDIDDADVLKIGPLMATHKEVSHCYERPRREKWPYNVYTMVHGRSPEDCERVVDKIKATCKEHGFIVQPACTLYSTRELKKVSMKYFMENC